MSPIQVCPSRRELSDYISGALGEQQSDSITDHLNNCDDCISRLDNLQEASDLILQKLRVSSPEDSYMKEPQCEEAIRASRRIAHEFTAADESDELLGNYRLLKPPMGKGGMGTVYRAVHTKLKKERALKVLPTERMNNPDSVSRFEREMEAIAKLDHPNIVQAHDGGEADGKHYLAMELVEGCDLSTMVSHLKQLPVADACEIIRQAAMGLQHAHENALVHRDIKPSNIMVTPSGAVKVLDLGLALLAGPVPDERQLRSAGEKALTTGQIMGTIDYMAPEQIGDSHHVDQRVDVYGLGATLYQLLTGRAPYADVETAKPDYVPRYLAKLGAIATKPVTPITAFRDDVPRELIGVLDRMLAKNPDERYSTAAEVASALTPLACGSALGNLIARVAAQMGEKHEVSATSTVAPIASAEMDTDPATEVPITVTQRRTTKRARFDLRTTLSAFRLRVSVRFVVSLLIFIVASVLAYQIYFVTTDYGTLIVHIDDKDIEVTLRQNGLTVRDTTSGKEYTIKESGDARLKVGEYRLTVTDESGLKVDTDTFTLSRGGLQTVSITYRDFQKPEGDGPPDEVPPPTGTTRLVTKPTKIDGVNDWWIETRAHRGATRAVCFSPDGRLFAMAGDEGAIRIRDADTGVLLSVLEGHEGYVEALGWSPEGRLLASGGEDLIARLWDMQSASLIQKIGPYSDRIQSIAWSPDGSKVLIGAYGRDLRLWNVADGRLLARLDAGTQSVSWSPDGSAFASAGGNPDIPDESLRTWDVLSRKTIWRVPTTGKGIVHWSPTGNLVGVGDSRSLRFFEPRLGELREEFDRLSITDPQTDGVRQIDARGGFVWLPDGNHVFYYHGIWDLRTGQRIKHIPGLYSDLPHGISSSRDGNRVASNSEPVTIWDANSGMTERRFPSHPYVRARWSAVGNKVVIQSGIRRAIWDMQDIRGVRIFESVHGGNNLSPDGRAMALNSFSGAEVMLMLMDIESGNVREIPSGHTADIKYTEWAPNGQVFATASSDESLRLRDASNSKLIHILQGHKEASGTYPGYRLVFSTDSEMLASTNGETIFLWEVTSGSRMSSLSLGRNIRCLAFSPNGKTLAIGQNTDIVLYDVENRVSIGKLKGLTGGVWSIAWRTDGKTLVSTESDGTFRVWRPYEPDNLLLDTAKYLPQCTVSPDGTQLLSALGSTVLVTDLQTQQSYSFVMLDGGHWLAVNYDGHYQGSPGVERHLVYVVETEGGQVTLSPEQFSEKYNWINDPAKARLPSSETITGASHGQSIRAPITELATERIVPVEFAKPMMPMSSTALVTQPAEIAGLRSWSIDSVISRLNVEQTDKPVSISPDSQFLAVGNQDGALRIYSVSTGELLYVWLSHEGGVRSVDWSPDGKLVASIGSDRTARVWEFPSGRLKAVVERMRRLRSISWSPKGLLLAIGGESLALWTPDGLRSSSPVRDVMSLSWSPDGGFLAVGFLERIEIWRADTSELVLIRTFDVPNSKATEAMTWSPDGTTLVSCHGDLEARQWNIASGELMRSFGKDSCTYNAGCCWSPDPRFVAVCRFPLGKDGARRSVISIWDAETGERREDLRIRHTYQRSVDVAWSPDGRTIAAIDRMGRVAVFDMPDANRTFQIDKGRTHPTSGTRLWSINSRALICTVDDDRIDAGHPVVKYWDLADGMKWAASPQDEDNHLAWSRSGNRLAIGGSRICVIEDGKLVLSRPSPSDKLINAVCWGFHATNAIAFGTGDTVHIWNLLTDQLDATFEGHTGGVRGISWGPGILAVGNTDGTVRLWDLREPNKLQATIQHDSEIKHLEFSPDATSLAIASETDFIQVVDVATGARKRVLKGGGKSAPIRSIVWSDDSRRLFCACENGQTRVWDLSSDLLVPDVPLQAPAAQGGFATMLSPNGKLLARGNAARWLYDVSSGRSLGTIAALRDGHIIQISPHGHYMASEDVKDEIVYVGELDSGERITMTQEEFESRFGWKNDPRQARILLD